MMNEKRQHILKRNESAAVKNVQGKVGWQFTIRHRFSLQLVPGNFFSIFHKTHCDYLALEIRSISKLVL